MSLKAKLEAVIYAAEEPVTLAQLAVLFAGEALEWKAARDAERAPALPLPEEAAAEAAAESLASSDEPALEPTDDSANTAAAEPSTGAAEESVADPAELPEAAVGQSETEPEPRSEAGVETAHIASFAAPSSEERVEEASAEGIPAEAPSDEVSSSEPFEEAAVSESSSADLESSPESSVEASDQAPSEPSDDAVSEAADPNRELAAAVSAEEAEFEARRQERRRDREARETLRAILDELIAEYAADSRGIEIREIAGGYRMGTKPEMHDAVRAFVKSLKPPLKLSLPALETLAVIAYKQPVTAPEVGEIRGVDSAGVLGSLMSRKLIATAGRKQVVGRPMLYKTTREFLLRFGLKDISELPSMEEFEKMAAQELSEEIGEETAAQTGDLFAESETATVPEGEEPAEEATEAASSETPLEASAEDPETQVSEPTENQATGATPDEEEIEA